MSCFIMNPDSIRRIGYTLADILNGCKYSGTLNLAKAAARHTIAGKEFSDCIVGGSYNEELISQALHRINAQAYAGRYREPDLEQLPDPAAKTRYSLHRLPLYIERSERPHEWHFHLMQLLDCWLYQTAEDATMKDEKRIALQAFSNALAVQMVQHSEPYNHYVWGE